MLYSKLFYAYHSRYSIIGVFIALIFFGGYEIALFAQSTGELPSCVSNQEQTIYLPLIISDGDSLTESAVSNKTSFICADVTAPADRTVISSREVDIRGKIQSPGQNIQVELDGFFGTVDISGNFVIPRFPLVDGENALTIEFFDASTLVGTKTIAIFWLAPAEARAQITPDIGGSIEVTDTSSALLGAAITIPPHAAERSFRAMIGMESEHTQDLPYGVAAVSEAAVFAPIGETFSTSVTVKLPVNIALLPEGTQIDNVTIHALSDDGWIELPITSRETNTVETHVDNLAFRYIIASAPIPLKNGEVRITTDPSYATLYIDGFNTNLYTPATLSGIQSGEHTLKVYLAGYNEVFRTINVPPNGLALNIDLGVPIDPIPVVNFDAAIQDGMVVLDNVFSITGTVTYNGEALANEIAVVSLNGEDNLLSIIDGKFANKLSLLPGENQIEVRVTGPNGSTGVSKKVKVVNNEGGQMVQGSNSAPFADRGITVILTWDTDDTDVDLHIFDPQNNHAWYEDLSSIPGGRLDIDDTDGFGPETFTMLEPISGTYKVNVNYYSDHDNGPSTGSLKVFIGDDLKFSESYHFTTSDRNATSGLGESSSSFWKAYEFTIGALEIVSIETQSASPQNNAIFSTLSNENVIRVKVQAPESIKDEDIHFEIKETVEDFTLDAHELQVTNRMLEFEAKHKKLEGLTNPRRSHRLTYQIVAYTLDEQGQRSLESQPAILIQDIRSQIRQEYIDKKDLRSSFTIGPPAYNSIIDASSFSNTPYFTFRDFSAYSDFGPGLAIINDSVNIAQTLREAWAHPLLTTSGWRNPRRNDSLLNSVIDSVHQTGNAVDFNPTSNKNGWPEGVSTYSEAQRRLTAIARATFGNGYDVLFHANHLHIERD